MKLSLSGFLFENNYQINDLSFEKFLYLAKAAGYEGVELRKTQVDIYSPDEMILRYKKTLDLLGLIVTCLTARAIPAEGNDRDVFFKRYLDLSKRFGCKMLKVSGSVEWLKKACDWALEFGIVLAMNNHINSPTEKLENLVELIKKVDRSNFGVLYDSMHIMIAGQDCVSAIDVLLPYIKNVLVQCVRPSIQDEIPLISHEGKGYAKVLIGHDTLQDWPKIFERLRRSGYNGLITVIENNWPKEERETVAVKTAGYIKKIWK